MQAFLTDENFKRPIVLEVRRLVPDDVITSVEERGFRGFRDEEVLDVAAELGLVVLTHDRRTMIAAANARVVAGERMPGMVFVPWSLSIRRAIDDLATVIGCSRDDEWANLVRYLPI